MIRLGCQKINFQGVLQSPPKDRDIMKLRCMEFSMEYLSDNVRIDQTQSQVRRIFNIMGFLNRNFWSSLNDFPTKKRTQPTGRVRYSLIKVLTSIKKLRRSDQIKTLSHRIHVSCQRTFIYFIHFMLWKFDCQLKAPTLLQSNERERIHHKALNVSSFLNH